MSSLSFPGSRKRPHSPDYRDDVESEDEFSPTHPKYRKTGIGKNFPKHLTEKFRNLFVRLYDIPFKNFFMMSIRNGATLPDDTILIDDDDDVSESAVTFSDEKLDPLIEKLKASQKIMVNDYVRSRRQLEATRFYSAGAGYNNKMRNGCNPNDLKPNYHGNGTCTSRKLLTNNLKRSALVNKPANDIEIVFDGPEMDGIEILSESPSTKQKQVHSEKSRKSSSVARYSASALSQSSTFSSRKSQSFTANDMMRLQEKEQYKLLIEKFTKAPHYYPIAKKSQSDAGVQAYTSSYSSNHFKKEVLQQPIGNLIEKYYKPCQLVSVEKVKHTTKKEIAEIKMDDDDDDDEIQVLEIKLPQYRPKYSSLNYFSKDWLNELRDNVRIQTDERLKIVESQERLLERYKKERLLHRLRVDSLFKEKEFPTLTAEMEEAVDQALRSGNTEEILCKITSDCLLRRDMDTLNGLKWLNDLVINSYFDLIMERSKNEGYPSLYTYNTFFYYTLKSKNYQSVRRWTRKVDIFSFDLNFVPIHLNVHWCLAVIDHRAKTIRYYDSMGTGEENCLNILHDYLCAEYRDKKGGYLDPSVYTKETMKDIPQQMNGSDCGMFTCKYADYIAKDAEITFTQEHMQYFRRRMVYELLTSKLL